MHSGCDGCDISAITDLCSGGFPCIIHGATNRQIYCNQDLGMEGGGNYLVGR